MLFLKGEEGAEGCCRGEDGIDLGFNCCWGRVGGGGGGVGGGGGWVGGGGGGVVWTMFMQFVVIEWVALGLMRRMLIGVWVAIV